MSDEDNISDSRRPVGQICAKVSSASVDLVQIRPGVVFCMGS